VLGRVLEPANRMRLAALGGMAAVTTLVYTANPAGSAPYPVCPSRTFAGIDCPGCGGLRGTHALLHGQVADALDYNLLLPFLLAGIALGLALWFLPLIGRSTPQVRIPPWAMVATSVLLVAFTVLRNLPVPALEPLAADLTR
jgi:hypothetical protein